MNNLEVKDRRVPYIEMVVLADAIEGEGTRSHTDELVGISALL